MNRYLLKQKVKKRLAELVEKGDVVGFGEAILHPEQFLNDPNATEEDYRVVRETAKELAEKWGLCGKLFRVGAFESWDEDNSPIDLDSEKIYDPEIYAALYPDGLNGYMLGWSELDPRLEFLGLEDELKEKLSEIYEKVQAGEIPLESYVEELQPLLWNDFDPKGVRLVWDNGQHHAVYSFIYDLENGNSPLPLPRLTAVIDGKLRELEGRRALEYVKKNAVAPPELLKEVAYWAGRLHEGELNDEVEEVWERIEREASLKVKELLKEIDEKYASDKAEHPLDWAEVREVYENGFWSYVWESDGRNPEYAGYWYLKPDGTIDYFEVSSEVVLSPVGTKSEWTPKALIKAYEKITRAIDNAHPLSGTALYESAVENWIKEELRPYLEEKIEEAVRSIGVFPETKEEALNLAGKVKEELSKEGIPRRLLESVVGDGEIAEMAVEVEPDEPEEPDEDYDFSP